MARLQRCDLAMSLLAEFHFELVEEFAMHTGAPVMTVSGGL